MTRPSAVLVTCGGKWVGMVQHLGRALGEISALAGGRVVVADAASVTPAGAFADEAIVVPPIADPGYVDALLEVVTRAGISAVVPLIDVDVERLAPHAEDFRARGAGLMAPDPEVVALCLDKLRFQEFAVAAGLDPAAVVPAEELADAEYPLFHKRRRGFGSIGAGIAHDRAEAVSALERDADLVFFELLRGTEVSVDCFVDATGVCTMAVQRVRDKVVGGESWASHTVNDPVVGDLAARTIDALSARGLRGPANLQLFAGETARIVEVNPRLGSGSVLSNFASGGRLFRSVLELANGLPTEATPPDYLVGVTLFRFLGDLIHQGDGILAVGPSAGLSWPYQP